VRGNPSIVLNNGPGAAVTNVKKTIRVGDAGALEIINSAGSAIVGSLGDTGGLEISFIDMKPGADPGIKQGRLWVSSADGQVRYCPDGASWFVLSMSRGYKDENC